MESLFIICDILLRQKTKQKIPTHEFESYIWFYCMCISIIHMVDVGEKGEGGGWVGGWV
jgi:hypothetical protein